MKLENSQQMKISFWRYQGPRLQLKVWTRIMIRKPNLSQFTGKFRLNQRLPDSKNIRIMKNKLTQAMHRPSRWRLPTESLAPKLLTHNCLKMNKTMRAVEGNPKTALLSKEARSHLIIQTLIQTKSRSI